MQSIVELGLGITSGTLFGYQRSAAAPTGSAGPNQNASDFDWLDSNGQKWLHTRDGQDQKYSIGRNNVSASFQLVAGAGLQGSGPLTGSTAVLSLSPTGTAGTYNSQIKVNQYGQVTSGSTASSGGGTGLTYVPSLSASYDAASDVSGNILLANSTKGPVVVKNQGSSMGTVFQVLNGASSIISLPDNAQLVYRSFVSNAVGNNGHLFDTNSTLSNNNKVVLFRSGGGELAYIRSDGTFMFPAQNTGIDVTGSLGTLNVGTISASIVNVGRSGASILLSASVTPGGSASLSFGSTAFPWKSMTGISGAFQVLDAPQANQILKLGNVNATEVRVTVSGTSEFSIYQNTSAPAEIARIYNDTVSTLFQGTTLNTKFVGFNGSGIAEQTSTIYFYYNAVAQAFIDGTSFSPYNNGALTIGAVTTPWNNIVAKLVTITGSTGASGSNPVSIQGIGNTTGSLMVVRDSLGNVRFGLDSQGIPSLGGLMDWRENWDWTQGVSNNLQVPITNSSNRYTAIQAGSPTGISAGSSVSGYPIAGFLLNVNPGTASGSQLALANRVYFVDTSRLNGFYFVFEWDAYLTIVGANNVTWTHGLCNSTITNALPRGYYFRKASANTNWQAVSDNGTTATAVDTGVAPVASTMQKFRIEFYGSGTPTGAAQARFYINNNPVATISANQPATNLAPQWGGNVTAAASSQNMTVGPARFLCNTFTTNLAM
jgi:hypothetical protein